MSEKIIGSADITTIDFEKRVKSLAGENWHSGMIYVNKDLRRLIFAFNEIAELKAENERLSRLLKDEESFCFERFEKISELQAKLDKAVECTV